MSTCTVWTCAFFRSSGPRSTCKSELALVESDGSSLAIGIVAMRAAGTCCFSFGFGVREVPNQIPAPTARTAIKPKPIRNRRLRVNIVLYPFSMVHLLWQLGSDRLLKGNSCRIGVEQDIRVSSFDLDVTPLLRDDIEQSYGAIAVGLSHHVKIVSSLVAHAAPVNRDPCLCCIEANQVLRYFMPKIQVHCRDLTLGSADCRSVGHRCSLLV